jgi:hypothetical protein
MTRVFLAAVLLAAAPPNSRADEATVRFTVRPMPAPKPALRYQLLPESAELSPGNAAVSMCATAAAIMESLSPVHACWTRAARTISGITQPPNLAYL